MFLQISVDFYPMRLYNKQMNDETQKDLEPVDVGKLVEEFSDHSIAELMLSIKELREKVDYEVKLREAREFKLQKAEELIEVLQGRINTSITVLSGESDICIDCEAVKKPEDTE